MPAAGFNLQDYLNNATKLAEVPAISPVLEELLSSLALN